MFKKEVIPHCEGLTPVQIRMVKRLNKSEYEYKFSSLCIDAIAEGWYEVLAAALKRNVFSLSGAREQIFSRVIGKGDVDGILLIAPTLANFKAERQATILANTIVAGSEAAINILWSVVKEPDTRAAAIITALKNASDASRFSPFVVHLIAQPLDLHYDSGALVKKALRANCTDIVDALVAQGFDIKLYGSEIEESTRGQLPHDALVHLQGLLRAHGGAAGALAAVAAAQDTPLGFQAPAAESITRIDALPTGGRLSTLFNFALRQQVVVAETPGPAVSVAVMEFAQMTDRHALHTAIDAFIAGGGSPAVVEGIRPRKAEAVTKLS